MNGEVAGVRGIRLETLRPARAFLSAAIFVVVTLAGCSSSSGSPAAEDDDGGLWSDIVDDASDGDAPQMGRVSGVVLHPTGFPIHNALVTVASVHNSVTTDENGSFAFPQVAPGIQSLRVEKESYGSLQKDFEVVAGKLTKLEAVLTPIEDGGFGEHSHNFWDDGDTFRIFQDVLEPIGDMNSVPPGCGDCSWRPIPIEDGKIVPPGTTNLSVTFDFEPGPLFEHETVTFRIVPPNGPDGERTPRYEHQISSGNDSFRYRIPDPGLLDHGHAKWTEWRFYVRWTLPGVNSQLWGGVYNDLFRNSFEVTITAHGALALDPPHKRYWDLGPELELEPTEPTYAQCDLQVASEPVANCYGRLPNPSILPNGRCQGYGCLSLAPSNVVPPGTTRVEFTIEHYWGDEAEAPQAAGAFDESDFIFGYTVLGRMASWSDYEWLEPLEVIDTENGVAWRYEMQLKEGETDVYYQKTTSWRLVAAVPGYEDADDWSDLSCSSLVCGHAWFRLLEFKAINENWDEMAGGIG